MSSSRMTDVTALPDGWAWEPNVFSLARGRVCSKLWWRNNKPDFRVVLIRPKDEVGCPLHAQLEVAVKRGQRARRRMMGSSNTSEYVWQNLSIPGFEDLPPDFQKVVLQGSGKDVIDFKYINSRGDSVIRKHPFEGVIPNIERRYRETDSQMVRDDLSRLLTQTRCPDCEGSARGNAQSIL